MSKFNELCNAYKKYREDLSGFRMACYEFGTRLISGYVEYLGVDITDFKVGPSNKVADSSMVYSIPGAMHLDNDAYWHLGFFLMVHMGKNTYPKQELRIEFMFKPVSDSVYLVSFQGADGPFLNVDLNSEESFKVVYEKLQAVITKMYKDDIDYLMGKNKKLTTIGFIQEGVIADVNKGKGE